ncbi:MAG: hypothetical protein ABI333_14110 [bacterium]
MSSKAEATERELSSAPPDAWRWLLLASAGLVLLGASLLLGQDAGSFGLWVWIVMLIGAVGGGLAIAAAVAWSGARVGTVWTVAVLAVAVLFRVALLPTSRYLSDDAYRYHWDGKVVSHGINPYRHPPQDPALDALRTDAIDRLINHPQVRTVYPPLAQLYFALGYTLTPGRLLGFQLLVLLSELCAWLLLLGELRRRGRSPAWILLAAWAPLVMFESYLPGHLDTLGLPWLALLVISLSRDRPTLAGAALAVACLIKPLPIIFVPAALYHLGRRKGARFLLVAAAVVAVAYLPVLPAGEGVVESLWLMARKWSFNGSLAAGLDALLPQQTARLAAAAILAALLLGTVRLGSDLTTRLLLAMAAFVICTPNLYAWYAVWMLPLLVLRPDPPLLALGLLLPFSEVVNIAWRVDHVWAPPLWPSILLYGVFYPLLIVAAWRRWGMFTQAPVLR